MGKVKTGGTTGFYINLATIIVIFGVLQAQVQIVEPSEIAGSLDHEISTFGFVDYQATVNIEIFKWNSESGCDAATENTMSWKSSYPRGFIMRRGGCPYRQQAVNAHSAGARVVLVYRDDDQDIHTSTPVSVGDYKQMSLPPVVSISKKDGLRIKQTLEKGLRVIIRFDFEIEKFSIPVKVKFVYSPLDANSLSILQELITFNNGNGKGQKGDSWDQHSLMKFSAIPKILKQESTSYSPQESEVYCVPNTEFCAPVQPKQIMAYPWEEIVLGTLLHCLTSNIHLAEHSEKGVESFSEILEVVRQSLQGDELLSMETIWNTVRPKLEEKERFMQTANACFSQAIGRVDLVKPSLSTLNSLVSESQMDFLHLPSMFIEDKLVKGDLTPQTSVSAFCDCLLTKSRPYICDRIGQALNKKATELDDYIVEENDRQNPLGFAVFILFLSIIIIGGVYLTARGYLSRRMEQEVTQNIDSSIQQYMRISGEGRSALRTRENRADSELAANE